MKTESISYLGSKQKTLSLIHETLKQEIIQELVIHAKRLEACHHHLELIQSMSLEEIFNHEKAPYWAYWCLSRIPKTVFNFSVYRKELEFYIMKDPMISVFYAMKLKKPWKKAEKIIKEDPKSSLLYAKNVINGPWKPGENAIKQNPRVTVEYLMNVVNGPRKDFEKTILQDSYQTMIYSCYVLKSRWKKGEEMIKKDPESIIKYITHFRIGRWEEAEETLKQNDIYWDFYTDWLLRNPFSHKNGN